MWAGAPHRPLGVTNSLAPEPAWIVPLQLHPPHTLAFEDINCVISFMISSDYQLSYLFFRISYMPLGFIVQLF